ncbi:carbohydrate ABC transporter permease [Lacisediminihabitans changchengi]|uniref:Sugar ABC transporter permease n=1 Tax=Lacisediminihabitans changchengi TaxID=2787634 RepID=A0A934SLQ0_9MICO|nr:sugar ABC transporter permease [Lacisediminihabitans changchengi]MBK4348936.1 sugar ABC transporter permease [Lacisediminihabitans changchengi]
MGARADRREAVTGYAFVLPSFVGFLAFLAVPIAVVIWLSFQHWDLITPARFVGLQNWFSVFADGRFARSLGITAIFVAVAVPLQTCFGLLVGVLLSRRVRGSGLFRVAFLIPWISAPITLGIVWKWIFAPTDGLLNALIGHRVEWLASPQLVLGTIIFVAVWSNVGYVSLFFAAGLGAIPEEVIEAARIDGAGGWQAFWRIQLPLLRPTTFFVVVTGLISAFQIFDTVYALAPNGGPQGAADVVSGRIYHEAFQSFEFGHASVMALVLMVILVIATVASGLYFSKRTVHELS